MLPDPPPLRASDRDREAVVGLLAQASVDGRLTVEELAERAGLANGARTYDELKAITADLGSAAHVAPGAHGGAVAAAPVERHRAILSSFDRRGRWRLAPRNRFVTVLGSIHLDLRQALLPGPEVEIELVSTLGSALLLVPAGADVRVSGGNALGSCELHLGAEAPPAGAPVIHVIVGGALGSVEVRSEPRLGERLKQEAKRLARRLVEPSDPPPPRA